MLTPLAACLAVLLVRLKPAKPTIELGFHPPANIPRAISIGLVVGLALFLANRLLLSPLVELLTGVQRNLSAFDYLRGNAGALLQLLPLVWLSAGLCEEVVYRGYVITQSALLLGGSRDANATALLFSTVLFGLAHWHQGIAGVITTSIVAIVLGLLFLQQRRNLWANVIAHITADTVSLLAIATNWDRGLDHVGRAFVSW